MIIVWPAASTRKARHAGAWHAATVGSRWRIAGLASPMSLASGSWPAGGWISRSSPTATVTIGSDRGPAGMLSTTLGRTTAVVVVDLGWVVVGARGTAVVVSATAVVLVEVTVVGGTVGVGGRLVVVLAGAALADTDVG